MEKGYDHQFVFGEGTHNPKHGASILPDALRWLWRDYPHAQLQNSYVREYPDGSLAAHAVGYVGRIDQAEYAARKVDGYQELDQVGQVAA